MKNVTRTFKKYRIEATHVGVNDAGEIIKTECKPIEAMEYEFNGKASAVYKKKTGISVKRGELLIAKATVIGYLNCSMPVDFFIEHAIIESVPAE